MRSQWQIVQGQKCPCQGSNEMCGCQNVSPEDQANARLRDPGALLDWMTYHHLPLEMCREEESQLWVVVDTSASTVIGSGESCEDALFAARSKEAS